MEKLVDGNMLSSKDGGDREEPMEILVMGLGRTGTTCEY